MPTRVLREGILTSKRVNKLTPCAELFYRRLMSVVDDFGRYFADPTLLLSACYPLQIKKIDESEIENHIAECIRAKLMTVYDVDGTDYLQMLDTRQQVRAKKSKFPPQMQCTRTADDVQPVQQVQSKCTTDVYGGGGGGGGGDEVEVEDGGVARAHAREAGPAPPPLEPEKPNPPGNGEVAGTTAGVMAVVLIQKNVAITSMHPTLLAWIADGFSLPQILDALEVARQRKPPPQKIHANYLDRILRDPPKRAEAVDQWWLDDDRTMAKAQELGVSTYGKQRTQVRQDINDALARRKAADVARDVSRETDSTGEVKNVFSRQ